MSETALLIYTPVLSTPTFVENIAPRAIKPTGRIQLQGGDFLYQVTLKAEPTDHRLIADLQDKFYNWLAYDLREDNEAVPTWRGLVYQMTLTMGRSSRVRSLRHLFNAVRARYSEDSLQDSEERCVNGGFETLREGDSDHTYEDWGDILGDGSIYTSTAYKHSGDQSCRLTAGTNTNTQVGKTIRAYPGKQYCLTFWTRGDNGYAGRYEVRNVSDDSAIVALKSTGVTGDTWTLVTEDNIEAPAGCHGISIRLRCPSTNAQRAYFDDVSFKSYDWTSFYSDFATQAESIGRYGRRDRSLTETLDFSKAAAEAARDTYLAEHAWPWARANERPIGRAAEVVTLEILAIGYYETINWRLCHTTGTSTVSARLLSLITTYGLFFTSLMDIVSNTKACPIYGWMRAGKQIEHLVNLRDASNNHYHVEVDGRRQFHYRMLDLDTPAIYAIGDQLSGQLGGSMLKASDVRPGLLRDMGYPAGLVEQGSWLARSEDTLVDEVRRGPDDPRPRLYAANFGTYHLNLTVSSEYPFVLKDSVR